MPTGLGPSLGDIAATGGRRDPRTEAARGGVGDFPAGGRSDANVAFRDLRLVLRQLGFEERIRGDHHIFTRPGVVEILNVQPKVGKAKAYQVRQVREIVRRYRLGGAKHGR